MPAATLRGASASADVPRRCWGLTEDVTARAVGSEMRYNGRGGVVRRADPFSVNPGPRPGLEIGVGMHRKAVPL